MRKGNSKAIGKKRRVAKRPTPGATIGHNGGPPLDDVKTHLTINELAREWGVNRATMYRVHLPKLPTVKFGGKRLIARDAADKYWAACHQAPGAIRGGRPEQRAAGAP